MPTEFRLEIFFEQEQDKDFAEKEAEKLLTLVTKLAPHINLRIKVQKASRTYKEGDIPVHDPIEEGSQTLLITHEEFGPEEGRANREGRAGSEKGCLSKQKMVEKERKGGNSADITIHEWLHTIAGKTINGREIPHPHQNASYGFSENTATKGPNGAYRWYNWYRYILREYP